MYLLRFSFLFLITVNFAYASQTYDCLNRDFDVDISHKGKLWGLLKNHLKIHKEKCIIDIQYSKYHEKIGTKHWIIDVCREPVHIKVDSGGIEVQKRVKCEEIQSSKSSDFCDSVSTILVSLQDEGLIFAQGEKEDLNSEHGQVYCVYDVLKKYLNNGEVLSRFVEEDKKESSETAPSSSSSSPIKEESTKESGAKPQAGDF